MRTIFKSTIKIIEWVVFAVLIIIFFLITSSLLPSEEILSTYSVSTGSMDPAVKPGSLVFVTGTDKYGIGDVIVFESPISKKDTIVHRVVDISNINGQKMFITKGDANDSIDDWEIGPNQIKGSVIASVPYLGSIIENLREPAGFMLLLAVPVLIFIIMQFFKIREGINEEVEKRTEIEVKKRLGEIEEINESEISVREQLNSYISGSRTNRNYLLLVLSSILAFSLVSFSGSAFAFFSSTSSITGINISISDEIIWSGGLEVINKTNGENLNDKPNHASSEISQNIVFRPEVMNSDAHHFTIIVKRMEDDSMIHYRTMLSRWTMDNFRKDGHLGYTFWESGDYWLQVNSYHSDGSVEGYYYAILTIQDILPEQIKVDSSEDNFQNFDQEEIHDEKDLEDDEIEEKEEVDISIENNLDIEKTELDVSN